MLHAVSAILSKRTDKEENIANFKLTDKHMSTLEE